MWSKDTPAENEFYRILSLRNASGVLSFNILGFLNGANAQANV